MKEIRTYIIYNYICKKGGISPAPGEIIYYIFQKNKKKRRERLLCMKQLFCPVFGNIVGANGNSAPSIFQFPTCFGDAADKNVGDKKQGRYNFP